MNKDRKSFWSGIRKSNNSRLSLASTVNQYPGENNIAEMLQDHYTAILNTVQNSNYKEKVKEEIAKMGTDSVELTVSNYLKFFIH